MTRDEFIEYLSDKNNIKLTNEQKDIVFTINGPHTVISTAGSGKTTILCAKIANLILCNSVSTERILVVTFSRASAVDMDNRFKTQYGELVSDSVNFSTIHSFALSVVKNYFYKINKPFEIIEGGNASITKNKLLSILCKKHTGENVNEDKLKDVSGYISYIKNLMILYKDLDNYEDQYPLPKFKEIYKEYEDYKRDINQNGQRLMDYDDMLSMCYHVLKNNPSILKKYRNKYDYYLVDEAQDTSRVQHEILKLLAAPKFNICLVGDDSQSIYSWRGADVQEFIDFKTTYHRDGKILFMGQNFRSSKTIVDSSARFILENAKDRIEKKIYTNNETGQPIKFIGTDNEYEQNGYILNQLDRNNLKETAILYRNNISAIPIVDELIRNNISYYIKDDIPSFFNHFVTNDLLAIISFANDQCNVGKFENIYYKIKSYVSKQDILSLNYENRNKNVFDLLLEKSTSKAREKELKKFKIKFDLLSKMVPEKAFYYIENSLNYKEYIEDFSKILNYSIDSVENIISTLKIIAKGLNTIEEFIYKLDHMKKSINAAKANKNNNSVTLLTAHGSKGLEFEQIIVCDLIDEIFPCKNAIDELEDNDNYKPMDEEARLYFVACTRAKQKLHLVYPKFKNNKTTIPSRFYTRLYNICNPNMSKSKEFISKNGKPVKIEEGTIVLHRKWGVGKITNVYQDAFTLVLDNGESKTLSIEICEKNNILQSLD